MNNRILATLFALAIALFIGVAPVKAEAAHVCVDDTGNCVCDYPGCTEAVHKPYTTVYVTDENGHALKCQNCKGAVAELEEHTYTFTDMGETHIRKCSVCNKETTLDHVDADKDCECDDCECDLTHNLVDVLSVKVTCTTDGVVAHKKCETCGTLISKVDGRLLKAEEVVIKAPGHKADTVLHSDEENHYYMCVNDPDGDKNICGERMSVEAHTPGKWNVYSSDTSKHFQICTKCNETLAPVDHVDADKDCACDDCGKNLGHTIELVHYVAETCEKNGNTDHRKCTTCGKLFAWDSAAELTAEDVVLKAKTHQANGKWENDNTEDHYQLCANNCGTKLLMEAHTPGECREYPSDHSKHFQQCTVCYRSMNIEAHDFEYQAKDYGIGEHLEVCKDCGSSYTVDCNDADGDCKCDKCGVTMYHGREGLTYHAYKDATCIEAGNHGYYTCNTCGVNFEKDSAGAFIPSEDYVIEALGHKWEYHKATQSTQSGLHVATLHVVRCANCETYETMDHTDTDGDCLCDINGCGELVHTHNIVPVAKVEPSCGVKGTEAHLKYEPCGKLYDLNGNPISAPVEIPALDHVAGDDYEAIEGDLHAIKCVNCGEVMTTAAHTDDNEDNRCDVCKVELALEYVEQQDPTCTNIGYKGYWVSKYTERKYADVNGNVYITAPEKIPSLGHMWNSANSRNHICGRCGATAAHVNRDSNGCVCDICYMPVSGHALTYVEEVAATCTKSGTQAYVKCECGKIYDVNSGEIIRSPIVIPSGGHKPASTVVNDTRTGEHYSVCTVCGKKVYSEHETVLEDPLKGNYHQWVCECGYSDPVTHKDTDGDNKCDECGHDMANTPVKVEQHDSVTVITGEKKTVNNSKSWLWNWVDKLLPGTSGGTSTSSNAASGSTPASSGNVPTSGGSNPTSGGDVSSSGGSDPTSSSDVPTSGSGTGIINEFIQWLSHLFDIFLQSR